jgi:hypothetical protein
VSLPEVFPQDPLALIRFLRGGEFRLGTGEVLRTVELLERLTTEGRAPTTPADAARWLAPVLCVSPRQQDILLQRLQAYKPFEEDAPPLPPPHRRPPPPPPPSQTVIPRWVRVAALIALLGIACLLILRLTPEITSKAVNVTAQPSSKMVTSASITFAAPAVFRGLSSVLPLALVPPLGWLLWVRIRRLGRPVLERRPFDGRRAARLHPAAEPLELFASTDLTHAVQGMRAHRKIASLRVDARASAHATARAAGRPVLVTGSRPRLPDYPIIVEQLAARDHLPVLARAFAGRLSSEGVPNALYLSSEDFRWLRHDSEVYVPTTLADLTARYDADVLLIIGDGTTLLDPLSGRLEPTLTALEDWRVVVLLTPVPRRRWSWRERHLALAGVVVLPVTSEGVGLLGDFLRAEGKLPRLAIERPPVRPGLLMREGREAFRWHRDYPPSETDREATLDAIALELPPGGFELACVLALFPEVRPDLTLHAASIPYAPETPAIPRPPIGTRRLADESAFAALAALPWFRYGRIPDWLRIDLVRSLRPERAVQARAMYAAWLSTSGRGGSTVQITSDTLGRTASEAAVHDPESPLRDAIFLRFARGEEPNEIELDAPDAVVQAVRSDVQRWERRAKIAAFGLSGLILVAAAVITASGVPVTFDKNWPIIKIGVIGFFLCLAIGPIFGMLHAWRGWSDTSGRFGAIPLAAVCAGFAVISPYWLVDPPDMTGLWVFAAVATPLSMALAPGHQVNWRRVSWPIVSGALEAVTLPGALVAAVGMIASLNALAKSDVDAFLVFTTLTLGLHGVGVGMLFARSTGLPAIRLVCQTVTASWFGYQVSVFVILIAYVGSFIGGGSAPETALPSLKSAVVAIGLVSPYLASGLAMNTKHGVTLGPSMLIWAIAAAAMSATLFAESRMLPFIGLLPALPVAAILMSVAAIRPWELREGRIWRVVMIAAGCSYLIGVSVWLMSGSCCVSGKTPIANPSASIMAIHLALLAEFIPLPAALACMASLRSGAGQGEVVRAGLRAYWPAPATRWIVVLWCAALNPALPLSGIDMSPAYLPLALGASLELGPPGLAVLLWGGLPLLIGMDLGPVATQPHPDLFIASVALHWLITETRKRNALTVLKRIGTAPMLALILLGAVSIRIALPGDVALGGDVAMPVGLALVLAGAMGTSWNVFLPGIATAAALDIITSVLARSAPNGLFGIDFNINTPALLLLFLLGKAWIGSFTSDVNARNVRVPVYAIAVVLVLYDLASPLLPWLPLSSNIAVPFAAFIAIGSLQSHRGLLAILVIAAAMTAIAGGAFAGAALVTAPLDQLPHLLPRAASLALTAAVPALSGALAGWRLGRWARSDGAEWLRLQAPPTVRPEIGEVLLGQSETAVG